MTKKALNALIETHLALKEEQKALNARVEASKKLLTGFDGKSTDRFTVALTPARSERVVGKEILIDALGINTVMRKGLLKEVVSYTLRILTK